MSNFSWNNRQFVVVLPNGWTVSTVPDGPHYLRKDHNRGRNEANHTQVCEVWAWPPKDQPTPDEYSDPARMQTPAEWFAYLTKVAAL